VAADRNPLNALGFARAAAAAAALRSACPDAAASFARDRLTREAAERVAAAELETTRARFECEAVERSEDLFALLDRGYDLPLALRRQSHHVWALRCVPSLKPVRPDGQRYRNRALLLDAVTHRVLYQWTY
jgi:hypothetical protein